MRPAILTTLFASLILQACSGASPSPAPRPLPGFKLALSYRVDLAAALGRQQLQDSTLLTKTYSNW